MNKPNISRRNFLRLAGGAAAGAGLAGILGCHDEKKVIVQGSGVSPFCNHPPANSSTIMRFDPSGIDRYQLEFTNQGDIFYDMPLIRNLNGFTLVNGSGVPAASGYPLKIVEYAPGEIYPGTYFILNKPGDDFTHVLRYMSHDPANRQLEFSDLGTGTRQVIYDPTTNIAELIVDGNTHKVQVKADDILAIDFDGDGKIDNGIARIVNKYGAILELDATPEPEPAHMKLITPKERFCGTEDEVIDMYVRKLGQTLTIDVPDQKNVTFSLDSTGSWVGQTKGYGHKIYVDRTNVPGPVSITTPSNHVK